MAPGLTHTYSSRKPVLIALGCILGLASVLLSRSGFAAKLGGRSGSHTGLGADECTPLAYDQGHWRVRDPPVMPGSLNTMDDLYRAVGFKTCLAQYQQHWNWGLPPHDGPYNDYAAKFNYTWQPHPSCRLKEISDVEKLQALIDRPLFLNGDSRTRQHFFGLSCELSEVTIWRGASSDSDDNGDTKAWRFEPQHLFVDPQSAVFSKLRFPPGFDINKPILSYLMAYHPLSRLEMRELKGPGLRTSVIPDFIRTPTYLSTELPMNRTLDVFTAPDSHYKVMSFSTGAHFSSAVFIGDFTVQDCQAILRASLKVYFAALLARMRPDQRLIVRAAAQAHSYCNEWYTGGPLSEPKSEGPLYGWGVYNEVNEVLEAETLLVDDDRVQWIGTGRLSRLRGDAHLHNDCQHFSVGSGVFEAISRYTWYILIHMK